MRAIEPLAAKGEDCSMYQLMQRAGEAAFKVLLETWPLADKVLVVAGSGNNAGDGYVLATLAKRQGLEVMVACSVPDKTLAGDAKQAQTTWQTIGGKTKAFSDINIGQFDLVVDAILGTGVTGDVKTLYKKMIQRINQAMKPVLSIDIPSGINADTGQAQGACVQADVTVTFVATKPGLVTGIGKQWCGRLVFSDLAVGNTFFKLAKYYAQQLDWAMLQPLPARPVHANKGAFGKLLCIGGNAGMGGAIRLSAEAALRSGAGLVKVFCHETNHSSLSSARPEVMLVHEDLQGALDWCSCVIIGPGLGQDDWALQQFVSLFEHLQQQPKPLVIDADALNLLANNNDEQIMNTLASLPALIFTPHPMEASRLLDTDVQSIETNRYQATYRLAQKYHGTSILKGAGTIIRAAGTIDSKFWVCKAGNPGMATAGMGDLLTGVIGAFLAQGMQSEQAAVYGVCAHAEAGDRVATQYGQRGMIASDLLMPLRAVINAL